VFVIYVAPFLILGAMVRFGMKQSAIDLTDAQRQAGVHLGAGFSLELGARKNKATSVGGLFHC
jgi:hypothetical protein